MKWCHVLCLAVLLVSPVLGDGNAGQRTLSLQAFMSGIGSGVYGPANSGSGIANYRLGAGENTIAIWMAGNVGSGNEYWKAWLTITREGNAFKFSFSGWGPVDGFVGYVPEGLATVATSGGGVALAEKPFMDEVGESNPVKLFAVGDRFCRMNVVMGGDWSTLPGVDDQGNPVNYPVDPGVGPGIEKEATTVEPTWTPDAGVGANPFANGEFKIYIEGMNMAGESPIAVVKDAVVSADWYKSSGFKPVVDAAMIGFAVWHGFMVVYDTLRKH